MMKPRSPAELGKQAVISVDPNIPIRLYFRSADLLLKQARVYRLENDLEHAYVLYMKYTNLGISELPKHPAYKHVDNKKNLKILNKNCLEALEALEFMKPALEKAYNDYAKEVDDARKAEQEASIAQQTTQWQSQQQRRPVDTSDVANDWNLQDALKGVAGVGYNEGSKPSVAGYQKANYPSLSLHNQSDGFAYHAQQQQQNNAQLHVPSQPPRLPPKPPNQPALPPKIPVNNKGPELPPKIKLEDKEIHRTGPTTDASTERGEPLRKMLLPEGIHARFLSIAQPNTHKKIETCGILAGTLITTLIIPKQTGTSDTCTTENEEDLFDIQDKHDLLTFGWIHLMLPEAIAIVCAPSQRPNFGIFRLTDPPGLDVISNCKKTPAFHPHPDLPIYTGAEGGGHVRTADYEFTVLDLRDKK
ncbi:endosome-associated ubiquitin isopeptidase [Mucor ambiguus]|uniref:Endosome-associated ubiquitin isopeptidase n=1 Tax=Mucor ambiguus TaxID=91626 RepID=A0A0C9MDV6_9FUNG|nr:endosome-associated ubiquitin isopeptidase [Mucor ambiguus]